MTAVVVMAVCHCHLWWRWRSDALWVTLTRLWLQLLSFYLHVVDVKISLESHRYSSSMSHLFYHCSTASNWTKQHWAWYTMLSWTLKGEPSSFGFSVWNPYGISADFNACKLSSLTGACIPTRKWWIFSLMCGSKKVSMNRSLNPHLFGEFLIVFSVVLHASISETGSMVRMKGAS